MAGTARHQASARARELGARLRQQREQAAMSGRALARRVHWPHAKVCLMETGARPPSGVDVAAYLAGCGPLHRPVYEDLVALAKEPDTGYLLRPHTPELPDELRSLIIQESLANTITSYEPLIIPGLLQTENYIRELFRWGSDRPADEIELRVRARLARQGLLYQQRPPRTILFVAEHALRTAVGSAGVMSEQLLHLIMASHDRNCTVRLVLDSAGPFGAVGGMFMLFDYVDYRSLAYTETWTTGLFVEHDADVALYQKLLAKLDSHALDAAQSRAWLADAASAYDQMEASTQCPPKSWTG